MEFLHRFECYSMSHTLCLLRNLEATRNVFVSLWEASVSFLCTPEWRVWLPDSIRLSEISAHEGAVKLVKAPDSCPSASVQHNANSNCECGTILIGCLHCHRASQMCLSFRAYCRGSHRSWSRSERWSLLLLLPGSLADNGTAQHPMAQHFWKWTADK